MVAGPATALVLPGRWRRTVAAAEQEVVPGKLAGK